MNSFCRQKFESFNPNILVGGGQSYFQRGPDLNLLRTSQTKVEDWSSACTGEYDIKLFFSVACELGKPFQSGLPFRFLLLG
jgi:hypothetical protein